MSRFIIIEGGIGVGKSTLINKLKEEYKDATFIGEYIEEEGGKLMFNMFRSGKISTEDFQHYILQYWKRKLSYHKKGLFILERGPLAGLAFVNALTMKNFNDFENEILSFMDDMNLNHFKFINTKARMGVESYTAIINNFKGNLVLFLEAPPKELLQGVRERGREGEETYTEEFLRANQDSLHNLYTYYKDDLGIELVNSN